MALASPVLGEAEREPPSLQSGEPEQSRCRCPQDGGVPTGAMPFGITEPVALAPVGGCTSCGAKRTAAAPGDARGTILVVLSTLLGGVASSRRTSVETLCVEYWLP